MDRQFSGVYENHFLNYAQDTRYAPLEEDGSLLIIAYRAYAASMLPLVEWKNQKGLADRMVTLSETGSTYSQIFSYIQNEYQTTDLAYVLLVGDGQHVPKYGSDSDPAYSLLAGTDSYPEIFVGRFSAESPEHVMTQVERTIAYERDTPAGSGSDWLQCGTGIASNQGPGHFGEYDDEHMDYIRDDLLGYGYDQVDQIYDPGASPPRWPTAVNAGRGIINYVGHGSTNAWSTSGFSNTNVNALTNDGHAALHRQRGLQQRHLHQRNLFRRSLAARHQRRATRPAPSPPTCPTSASPGTRRCMPRTRRWTC